MKKGPSRGTQCSCLLSGKRWCLVIEMEKHWVWIQSHPLSIWKDFIRSPSIVQEKTAQRNECNVVLGTQAVNKNMECRRKGWTVSRGDDGYLLNMVWQNFVARKVITVISSPLFHVEKNPETKCLLACLLVYLLACLFACLLLVS